MVDFVLQHSRQVSIRLDPQRLVVEPHRLHGNAVIADHFSRPARNAEATFEPGLLAIPPDNFGIDQRVPVFRVIFFVHTRRDMHRDDPAHHPDLRTGQSHTVRVFHRFPHVFRDPSQLVVCLPYLLGAFAKTRIAVYQNLHYGHWFSTPQQTDRADTGWSSSLNHTLWVDIHHPARRGWQIVQQCLHLLRPHYELPLVFPPDPRRERRRRAEDVDDRTGPPSMPGDLARHVLRVQRRLSLLVTPNHVPDQPGERWKLVLLSKGDLRRVERIVIMISRRQDRVMPRRVGLDHHPASRTAPPGPARHLGQELEGALGSAKVWEMHQRIRAYHPDCRHTGQIEPFRHHLCPHHHVHLAPLHPVQHRFVAALASHAVLVPTQDRCPRIESPHLLLHSLGARAEVVELAETVGASMRRRNLVVATMADQDLAVPVKYHGNIAVRANQPISAGAAQNHGRLSTPVQ